MRDVEFMRTNFGTGTPADLKHKPIALRIAEKLWPNLNSLAIRFGW
jgi:hypothetical protein